MTFAEPWWCPDLPMRSDRTVSESYNALMSVIVSLLCRRLQAQGHDYQGKPLRPSLPALMSVVVGGIATGLTDLLVEDRGNVDDIDVRVDPIGYWLEVHAVALT